MPYMTIHLKKSLQTILYTPYSLTNGYGQPYTFTASMYVTFTLLYTFF